MDGIRNRQVDGLVRGALGGLAGLVAMGVFFRASQALSSASGGGGGGNGGGSGSNGRKGPIERRDELDDISIAGQQGDSDEPATATAGRLAYEAATGDDPDEETKRRLGQAVHWSYGVLLGGVYGVLRSDQDGPDLLGGLGYGAVAWLLGDELMVPLLGLSEGPTAHGWTEHAKGLGAHLVYGAATAAATQALERVV